MKKKNARSLVIEKLENISKMLFKKYNKLVTDLIGNSPGIYALYDEGELYYVGKSTDLKKRVERHLKDRHYANWTHFSLYLVRRSEHIAEIESLLIRIADPKGNSIKPKGRAGSEILNKLKKLVREKQHREYEEMFGEGKLTIKNKKTKDRYPYIPRKQLKNLVTKNTLLHKTYKGKDYKAILTSTGLIKVGNKNFTTPTAAAKSIVKRKTVNGWKFWFIKNRDGDLVKLADYNG